MSYGHRPCRGVFPAMIHAAVPQQLDHQGYLTDPDGVPVADGSYFMVFAIYDADVGGTMLWSESQTVSVAIGIYNVILGQPGNELDPTIFEGDRYLGVSVEGDAEMTPRLKLTSAAFALKAAHADDADTLDGMDSTALDQSAHVGDTGNPHDVTPAQIGAASLSDITWGNLSGIPGDIADGDQVGITDETDPTVDPSVKDGVSWGELSGIPAGFSDNIDDVGLTAEVDPQVGSNTTNRIPVWNGSALVTGSIHDNGSIGIGTSIPDYKLDVRGDRIQLKEDASGDWIAMRTDGDVLDLQFEGGSLYFQGTSDGENILLNPNRDSFVGIGKVVPQSRLDIRGGTWDLVNSEGDFKIGTATHRLKIGVATAGLGAGDVYITAQGGTNRLKLGSGEDTVLSIKDGNVGIGETLPSEKLEVIGDIKATGNYTFSSPKTYYLNIPACAFIKDDTDNNTVWAGRTFKYTSSMGSADYCHATAPVYLPQGATVTSVTLLYYDNHASEDAYIYFSLFGRLYSSTAINTLASDYAYSSGSSTSIQQLTDDTINFATISDSYCYLLFIVWDPTHTTFSDALRCYGARIEYTLTIVAP